MPKANPWPVHPAADRFPLLTGPGLADLTADITVRGLQDPLVLYRDPESGVVQLLDGRNRLAACVRAGVEPVTRFYEGDDPLGFVISANLYRRQLSTSQRAAIAAELLPDYEARAAARKAEGLKKAQSRDPGVGTDAHTPVQPLQDDAALAAKWRKPQPVRTVRARDEAAAALGVSGRSVQKAKKVKEDAPDLHEEVKAGKRTLNGAERVVKERAKLDPEQRLQTELAAEIQSTQRLLRGLVAGFPVIEILAVHAHRDRVLSGLSPADRDQVLRIERIYLAG
jgi:hypothetical protein